MRGVAGGRGGGGMKGGVREGTRYLGPEREDGRTRERDSWQPAGNRTSQRCAADLSTGRVCLRRSLSAPRVRVTPALTTHRTAVKGPVGRAVWFRDAPRTGWLIMMSRAAWQSPRTSFSVKATFLSRFVLFRTSSSLPISASASHMAALAAERRGCCSPPRSYL